MVCFVSAVNISSVYAHATLNGWIRAGWLGVCLTASLLPVNDVAFAMKALVHRCRKRVERESL